MQVSRSIAVLVLMKMNPVAAHPPDDVETENHEHDADGELEPGGKPAGHHAVDKKHDRPKEKERDRVADAPERAVTDALRRRFGARRERRDRSDMVRLERVAHPDEKAQNQKSDHRLIELQRPMALEGLLVRAGKQHVRRKTSPEKAFDET